jgi:hypothetical protein
MNAFFFFSFASVYKRKASRDNKPVVSASFCTHDRNSFPLVYKQKAYLINPVVSSLFLSTHDRDSFKPSLDHLKAFGKINYTEGKETLKEFVQLPTVYEEVPLPLFLKGRVYSNTGRTSTVRD